MSDKPTDSPLSRRSILTGAAGLGISISVSGCMDVFSDDTSTETDDGQIDPNETEVDRSGNPELDEESDLRDERRQIEDPETPAEYFVYIYQRYSRSKALRDIFVTSYREFTQSVNQRNFRRAESVIDDLLFYSDTATRNLEQAISAMEEISFEFDVSEEREMLEDLEYAYRITPDVAIAGHNALQHREENEIRDFGRELSNAETYFQNFLSREDRTVSPPVFGRSLMTSLQVDINRERLESRVEEELDDEIEDSGSEEEEEE